MEKEEKKIEEETKIGLVTLTGKIGIGMKMPDGEVIQLNDDGIGTAKVLAYLVETVSEIKKNLG